MSSKLSGRILLKDEKYGTSAESFRVFPKSPDDEIVVSGMAGRYPNCNNVEEFRYHLYNKLDMTTDKEARWKDSMSQEFPARKGIISNLNKFDAAFFGIHPKQVDLMDPQGRLAIEIAYEAVLDAGIHPQALRNTKCGVFLASCFSEAEKNFMFDNLGEGGLALPGISYCLGLIGPSFVIDTACSSGMFALDSAFTAIRNGQCDSALVLGTNLLLHPFTTINFNRLGVISKEGRCRAFDEKGSGYARAETICALFIQKACNAKRIYAKLVYSNVNCDGYKDEGLLYPKGEKQEDLMREFYADLKLDPRMVSFVEAHGTGTRVGDPEECRTLDRIFCTNRKEPLLIGSVKSNMGHSEASSGICSITKVCLAFEEGALSPNINFDTPRQDIPSLVEGRLKVCTDVTPLPGNLVAVDSFGFGGANAHALLARFEKEKVNSGIPNDSVPRLVFWAGRTQEAIDKVFDSLESKPLDAEFVGLLHNIQKHEEASFMYRGYTILEKNDANNNNTANCKSRVVDHCDVVKRPVVWVFTGMGSQWTGMATSLMQLDLFRETIYKCHEILKPYGLDLISIITSTDETTFDNIIHSFVGIAAIQIGLVDVLRVLDVPFDYCIGHSVGELGCAYADGTLTAEQMIKAAYARGLVSSKTKVIPGSMAAIGRSYNQIKDMVPESIEIACHNSSNSATISGPKEDVAKFVEELKSKEIFAREVACSNIPYHSKYIAEMGPKLMKMVKDLVPQPVRRSEKWISSSVPKENWDSEQCQFSSAEYHTNNLLSPVLFEEASKNLPENAITIEVAPHGLLQAIIKKCLPSGIHIALTHRGNKENLIFFFGALGKLFLNGIHLPIERLYPAISYPVSRKTQMISPLISWDHSQDWFSGEYDGQSTQISCVKRFIININEDNSKYITGHVIDGRCIFPATAYLQLVRSTVIDMAVGQDFKTLDIEFENVRFLRATTMTKDVAVRMSVVVHVGSGAFEVSEGTTAVLNGTVRAIKNGEPITDLTPHVKPDTMNILKEKDFYKELRLRGYHYNDLFRSVVEVDGTGSTGKIKWQDNWPAFMDCMLQVNILALDSRSLYLPTSIRRIRIKTEQHLKAIAELDPEDPTMEVKMSKILNIVNCGGIEMEGLVCSSVSRRKPPGTEVLETYEFVPLNCDSIEYQKNDAVSIFIQIGLENLMQHKLKIVEIDTSDPISTETVPKDPIPSGTAPSDATQNDTTPNEPKLNTLIQTFDDVITNVPLVSAELVLLTKKKIEIDHVTISNTEVKDQTNCHFIIASNCLKDAEKLAQACKSLTDKGFLVLREDRDIFWREIECPEGFSLISVIKIPDEALVLLQRIQPTEPKSVVYIDSNDITFEWLQPLKESIKNGTTIAVERSNSSGLLGLVSCIRREPGGNAIRCVLIDDKTAPGFDQHHAFYADHLNLDLAINVYKNGRWGTFRHIVLKKDTEERCRTEHYYAHVSRLGDLSSFEWMTGWINVNKSENVVNVQYSAINFRDVMMATGRLPIEVHSINRLEQQVVIGLEYSGVSAHTGERMMGWVPTGGIATQIECSRNLSWKVPDTMSLRDAATIPAVYATVYYAFFFYNPISKGKSILIHAGSGGIGLAAIRIALAYGMEVYTTCSTEQKKKFILEQFPQLKEENIGNSRDCSFEFMIRTKTNGNGVDYVLNSLAEEKLAASVRCLGKNGTFLEIGKFDIMNNSKLDMAPFANEIQFRTIYADRLFYMPKISEALFKMMQRDIDNGLIQPLPSTVFQVQEVEKAFRYLSTGKHVGKVLIQIRENETSNASLPMRTLSKVYCDPHMVYVIPGGLGGFGLELADWLVLRGCRKLVLSSRSGIKNQYQAYRIKTWELYGCKVVVNTADITTHQGCKNLLVESLKHGAVGGIFNLAVLLCDSILENQTCDKYFESFGPKVFATRYLDELSRALCQRLKYFVVFSSAACGRGNAGQTNYGMANSIMERIIEKRVQDNLPGIAIQWGAIGEVGLVAQMAEDKIDLEIAGTNQQRISSCLNVLDSLLMSKKPVVSSIVVAQKHALSKMNLIQSVLHIMGIRDLKSVSKSSTLAELGMDSLMAVEIKQALEREFEIILTAPELRTLTFGKLQELTDSMGKGNAISLKDTDASKSLADEHRNMLLRSLGDENTANEVIIPLNETDKPSDVYALFITGIEGVTSKDLIKSCKCIEIPIYALQLNAFHEVKTLPALMSAVSKDVLNFFQNKKRFILIGHSFGGCIAIEMAKLLEQNGLTGEVISVDGSVTVFKRGIKKVIPSVDTSDEYTENIILMHIAFLTLPEIQTDAIQKVLLENKNYNERFDAIIGMVKQPEYSSGYLKNIGIAVLHRIKMIMNVSDEYSGDRIKSNITLIRPTIHLVPDVENDYNLKQYTNGRVQVSFIEGNHMTMLDNIQLYQIINNICTN